MLASVYVVGKTILSKATAPAPAVQPVIRIPPPTPDNIATPTPISKIASSSSQTTVADLLNQLQAANNTQTVTNGWKVVGSGDVTVTPQFSVDLKSLNVDFTSKNFYKITGIDYSLSYVADPQVNQLIKGSVTPLASDSTIRRVITLGTCSGSNCTYDSNPRGFTLKVLVKTNNGLSVYLITLSIVSTQYSVPTDITNP